MGAFFNYHNVLQPINVMAVTRDHLSTSHFPETLTITEEYYHYRTDPRKLPSPAIVLLTNSSALNDMPGSAVGNATASNGPKPQPMAWYRSGRLLDTPTENAALGFGVTENPSLFDDSVPSGRIYSGGTGRVFHTSLGHANETWMNPGFQGHILGGIMFVLQNSSATIQGPAVASTGGNTQTSQAAVSSLLLMSDLWVLVFVVLSSLI